MIQHDKRMDIRTVEQFALDIEKGHKYERDIINRYVSWVKVKYGFEFTIEDNGVDNSGQLLEKATTDADYLVNGKPLEVKFNNRVLKNFHIKFGQLDSYIRQDAHIVWVNGYETEHPQFTMISPSELRDLKKTAEVVKFDGWGGKECYRLDVMKFKWIDLPAM